MEATHSFFSSSLTDMMTSLMVIFVLLLTNYLRTEQGAVVTARSKTDEMRVLLTDKLKQSQIEGVEVTKLDNYNLVVIVPEDKLQFPKNRDELTAVGKEFLARFVPVLLDSYLSFEQDVSLVNVEGHTDRTLKSESDPNFNWDLSQKRASAVMRVIFGYTSQEHYTDKIQRFKAIALFGGRGDVECKYDVSADEILQNTCRTVKFKIRLKSSEESKE